MIQNRMNELFDSQEAELRRDRSTLEARFLEEWGGERKGQIRVAIDTRS